MNTYTKNHGLDQAVKVVKQYQLHLTRYLSGNPLYENSVRVGINSEGLPKILRSQDNYILEKIRERDPKVLRALLTVFTINRVHLGEGTLSPESIVDPPRGELSLRENYIL